jgi:hypothetical protein
MNRIQWGVPALFLFALAGCFSPGSANLKTTAETTQALPGGAFGWPKAVLPEQVSSQNARQQCEALSEELDREASLPR